MCQVINKISVRILSFLCKQYPLTKIDAPNIALRDRIQPINDRGSVEFDLVGQLCSIPGNGINFILRNDRNYTPEIMKCLNQMIIRSKKEYISFEKTMNGYFQEIFYKNKK